MSDKNKKLRKKITFAVKGMRCPSCVMLVESKLKEFKGVKKISVSLKKERAEIQYEGQPPDLSALNQYFEEDGYTFYKEEDQPQEESRAGLWKTAAISAVIIFLFYLVSRSGFSSLINVQSGSSLPTFFAFGLIAGLTSCAALVGGIILSLSKQWLSLYGQKDTAFQKLQPHLMFNTGRLVSYAVLGGVLGAIGSQLKISLTFTSVLVIAVSVIMFALGLQMIGVRALRSFQFSLPRRITGNLSNERKFKGRYLPFVMGALTFFLPCGFTITAQGLALISGSAVQGGLIMLFFALGTTLPLLSIGLAGVKFSRQPKLANTFLKVAGVLVVFFALFNINSQFNVLGWPSFSNFAFRASGQSQEEEGFPPVVSGKQVVKMEASARGYSPNYIRVKAGLPVRWEITDIGTSGCTNAVIAKSLFSGQIDLTPGKTSVKEFTPPGPGKYKFSCWMGMVTGTIEVVDKNASSSSLIDETSAESEESGVTGGCGCGAQP